MPGTETATAGFSLVITISLMVLLSLLAVGLMSLASISLRKSTSSTAQTEARANARMAIMVALGELQKQLGPDQRISAQAAILDQNPTTETPEGVQHPHFLGVWDSWDTWLTDKKGNLAIQDTYRDGRHPSLFRRWLVSHPTSSELGSALSASIPGDAALLCGEGSAGADPSRHVRAAKVPVSAGSETSGHFAWWVADESMKARLDLQDRNAAESFEDAQRIAAFSGRPGVESMSSMEGFVTDPESIAKMVSLGQATISATNARDHFHDLTSHSTGLFTDVRFGGIKKDLNLALEADQVPEEMQEVTLFGGRPFNPPIRPMTGALADINPSNPYLAPMSWRTMREYYRLYREFPGDSTKHPIAWKGGEPATERFVMGKQSQVGRWGTEGYTRLPILLRQTWVLATKSESNPNTSGGRDYYVLAVPIVSLWNPFDVAMEIGSEEISYMGSMFFTIPLEQLTYRGPTPISQTRFPDENVDTWGGSNPNGNLTGNQLGYRMIPSVRRGNIRFEPGEVRVFSTNEEILHGLNLLDDPAAMNSRHFFASPGYEPVQETGTGVLRGLKAKVNPGSGNGRLSIALRFVEADRHYDPFWIASSNKSAMGFSFHEWRSAEKGAYFDNGSLVGQQEWHDVVRLNTFSIDWMTSNELASSWVTSNDAAYRASFPAPGSPPLPIGIISIVAKSPEQLSYIASGDFTQDFRNRNWLHGLPTGMGSLLMNPNNLNRAENAYQIHFTQVNGDIEVSQYLEASGRRGFFGGGYSQDQGQTHVTALSLPTTPPTNLGSFAGIRMDPARASIDQRQDSSAPNASLPGRGYHNLKHMAHRGAAFAAGIGNAYAHPMIEPTEVYTRSDLGVDPGWNGRLTTGMAICDDYWDHLFLANEELWDSWFCSGMAPTVREGRITQSKQDIAKAFFDREESALSPRLLPHLGEKDVDELADLIETAGSPTGKNGWEQIGAHLMNQGQFNVNSTSKEAWKAMLMSLANRPIATNQTGSRPDSLEPDSEVTLSRFPIANRSGEATGPSDDNAWQGIRKLTEAQIDKLAEQIVRQVKLRGPFLNMAEFINRRLADDETGVTGALQAAIDWDEFDAGYGGRTSGSGASINAAYKDGNAMISSGDLPASYPNPLAATGSRYAGIPGYVMQSDLLQGLSTSLSVRGDTFLIRGYGESLDQDGQVAARAWCEAVVQRMPDYIDSSDEAATPIRSEEPGTNQINRLTEANQSFGRRFEIVAFRWLNESEV